MEDWVLRALERWPDVPALYGWLGLDRRGRWRIRGETISRPQIIDTINANYAADGQGRWYFQNGPQRGYVTLDAAPFVVHAAADGSLHTHTGRPVARVDEAWIDEEGSLLLATEHGPGQLADTDLDWALARMSGADGEAIDEDRLAAALAVPDGATTALSIRAGDAAPIRIRRLDRSRAPLALGFVRDPRADPADSSRRM